MPFYANIANKALMIINDNNGYSATCFIWRFFEIFRTQSFTIHLLGVIDFTCCYSLQFEEENEALLNDLNHLVDEVK